MFSPTEILHSPEKKISHYYSLGLYVVISFQRMKKCGTIIFAVVLHSIISLTFKIISEGFIIFFDAKKGRRNFQLWQQNKGQEFYIFLPGDFGKILSILIGLFHSIPPFIESQLLHSHHFDISPAVLLTFMFIPNLDFSLLSLIHLASVISCNNHSIECDSIAVG